MLKLASVVRSRRHTVGALQRLATAAVIALCALLLTQTADARMSPPAVLRVSPANGLVTGGQRVTIIGRGFGRVTRVDFGTTASRSIRVVSPSRLSVVTPRHRAGLVNVRVVTSHGLSKAVPRDRYRFAAAAQPPSVDSAVPSAKLGPLPTPFVPASWSGPNPPANCAADSGGVAALDYCGAAMEGLAPLPLPSNWASLSDPQQGFVLMNLERIERGETPLVGISATLDSYAEQGAEADTDPSFGPSIWASDDFLAAMVGFLYDDGPGPDGFNLACTSTVTWGCWGHRDNILEDATDPSLAAGLADGPSGDAAAVFADGYPDLNFSWASELAAGYAGGLPTIFTLTPPTISSVTSESDGEINLSGTGLDTGTAIYFSNIEDSDLSCSDSRTCTIDIPQGLKRSTTYSVYMENAAGLSAQSAKAEYTTAPR